jgi:hypothetical protein
MLPRVEPVRSHDKDDDPREELPLTRPHEALTRALSELERYAGWLAKDHVSVAVRADVRALGAAVDAGNETSLLLLTLDKHIGRLPRGDMRKMLLKALREMNAVLAPGGIDVQQGEGS